MSFDKPPGNKHIAALEMSRENGMKPFILMFLSLLVQTSQADSPVWLIESGNNQLYLAGTVHILRDIDYPLPDAFEKAYTSSKRLAFEVDIGQTQSASFQRKMMQAIALPGGTSIDQVLAPETIRKLQAYLGENGLNLEQFKGLKPSMIATTLTMIELQKLGVSNTGVDAFFYHKAREDSKPLLALESVEQQIRFLSQMGQGQEDMMILQTLREIETLEKEFSDMLTSWRQGNLELLEEIFIAPMKKDFQPIYRELLVTRNKNWLPQLKGFLQTPETEMVLVGSAHLPGEDGLLNLLKQSGFRISQLD